MEKPYALGVKTLQSIRKYWQYHRPIARLILFWLNDDSFMSRLVCVTRATLSDRSSKFLRLSSVASAFGATNELRAADILYRL
jgi:hypothetical protein